MRTEPTLVSRALHLTALVLASSLAACGSGDPTTDETTLDRTAPSVVVLRATSPDSIFAFTVRANDNLGVKFVSVTLGGAIVRTVADTVTSAVTAYTKDFAVSVPGNVTPGSQVTLISRAEDGNGNKSKPDTTVMAVGSRQPGFIAITSPQNNTQAVRGRSVVIGFAARTTRKVRLVGFTVTPPAGGTALAGDSIIFSSPLQDSLSTTRTFAIPATAVAGLYNVVPYVADSIGQQIAEPRPIGGIGRQQATAGVAQRGGIARQVEHRRRKPEIGHRQRRNRHFGAHRSPFEHERGNQHRHHPGEKQPGKRRLLKHREQQCPAAGRRRDQSRHKPAHPAGRLGFEQRDLPIEHQARAVTRSSPAFRARGRAPGRAGRYMPRTTGPYCGRPRRAAPTANAGRSAAAGEDWLRDSCDATPAPSRGRSAGRRSCRR